MKKLENIHEDPGCTNASFVVGSHRIPAQLFNFTFAFASNRKRTNHEKVCLFLVLNTEKTRSELIFLGKITPKHTHLDRFRMRNFRAHVSHAVTPFVGGHDVTASADQLT